MIFNLKKSDIYKAVMFYRYFPAGLLKFYRILFFVLGFIPLIFWMAKVFIVLSLKLGVSFDLIVPDILLWSYIFLPIAFSVLFFEIFGKYYLKHPRIKSTDNIAELMEFEAAKMLDRAFELSRALGEKELSVKALLASMIEDNVMEKLFIRG